MRPLHADFLRGVAPLVGGAVGGAADRYEAAGRLWADVAAIAVEGPLAGYRDLAQRRMELMLERVGGRSAARAEPFAADVAGRGPGTDQPGRTP